MKAFLLNITIVLISVSAWSNVEVLFHPYDSTLQKIAETFKNAEATIDMALYNIDTSKSNPVIKVLASEEIQKRIQNGDLHVRIIFEGYDTKEANEAKMQKLEDLGIDARRMGISKKMHHKFATVDTGKKNQQLITGSANWSVSSRRNYNENILYIKDKPGITQVFQEQFNFLWENAKEFGFTGANRAPSFLLRADLEPGFEVDFNTDNFVVTDKGFKRSKDVQFVLTKTVVDAIDSAKTKVEIATTRLKLRPIYEAILRAAKRGVKVDIVVSMGEYRQYFFRRRMKMRDCSDIYLSKCSSGQNFAVFLSDRKYEGKKNVKVRVKYTDLREAEYLRKQMHSKYVIVDESVVLTGSFNYSYSSEYNHFENIVSISGHDYPGVIDSFLEDHNRLWKLNRKSYKSIKSKVRSGTQLNCNLESMTLSFYEVDMIYRAARRANKDIPEYCL